jgi:DNA-directed RNA polymerase specialized sigma subunit
LAQRRTIFLLRTQQELSLYEIAEQLALSKSGVIRPPQRSARLRHPLKALLILLRTKYRLLF